MTHSAVRVFHLFWGSDQGPGRIKNINECFSSLLQLVTSKLK